MNTRNQLVGHRHFPRFAVALPITGRLPQGTVPALVGIVRNVSNGGLLVVFPRALAPETALLLTLQTQRGALELPGQVVWAAPQPEGVRHGIASREPQSPGFLQRLLLEAPAPDAD